MKNLLVFSAIGLLSLSQPLFAEHQQASINIYSNKPRLNIEKLNQTAELLRDPTIINESFRDALKRISPSQRKTGGDDHFSRPKLSLSALVAGSGQTYSAMIKIEDQVRLVKPGDKLTFIKNNELIEITIDEINAQEVQLTNTTYNERLILR